METSGGVLRIWKCHNHKSLELNICDWETSELVEQLTAFLMGVINLYLLQHHTLYKRGCPEFIFFQNNMCRTALPVILQRTCFRVKLQESFQK